MAADGLSAAKRQNELVHARAEMRLQYLRASTTSGCTNRAHILLSHGEATRRTNCLPRGNACDGAFPTKTDGPGPLPGPSVLSGPIFRRASVPVLSSAPV